MNAVRRHFHAHPELSLEKFETSQLVAEHLKGYGYQVTQAIRKTGVVRTLTKGSGGKSIGLRADRDTLPVDPTDLAGPESTQVKYMPAASLLKPVAIQTGPAVFSERFYSNN
jgi:metal-dependent amidase/aminoacylase/carboxypeptidase family protein